MNYSLIHNKKLNICRWIIVIPFGIAISSTAFINPLVTLILLSITSVVALSIFRPHIPYLFAVILISYISIEIRIWGDYRTFFNLSEPFILYCLFCWFISRGLRISTEDFQIRKYFPLILLYVWGCISILWSTEKTMGIYYMAMFFIALCFFFLTIVNLNSFLKIKIAIAFFVIMGFVSSIVCYYSLISNKTIEDILYHYNEHLVRFVFNPEQMLRGQGFMHPLATAYYLSLSLMLLLGFIYTGNKLTKFFLAIIAIVIFVALLTTLSKGPLLSLLCGLYIFTILNASVNKHVIIVWTLILSLIVFGFFLSRIPTNDFAKALDYTSKTSTETTDESSSLGSRIKRWKKGILSIKDHYGLGGGSGGFFTYLDPEICFDNLYVHIFAEYGLVGVLLWIWFLILSCKRFIQAYINCISTEYKKWMQIYIAGVATLLLNAVTSFSHTFLPIWFYLGIGHAMSIAIDRENKKRSENKRMDTLKCRL
ncbi:MAG: O-antigen ligase family protein [Planctomycetes bacterium]|nr:O-antigen ligase family protein [Planctomycetota bacterium]